MSDAAHLAAPPTADEAFSLEDFLVRAKARLTLEQPAETVPVGGDLMIDLPSEAASLASLRPAAVLLPVVARHGEAHMLLTQRAERLRQHSGQIAFPGGGVDAADASPIETALREAEEEIGLSRKHVAPLGYLDPYATTTGYRIFPVVAVVEPPFELSLNPAEVVEAFEVPLGFLMRASNHQRLQRAWQGRIRQYYAMPYGDRYIWGVTAGILRNLYERLYF
jgi:8-oxo-dGTP pyrophosphatase MutT (NUDIX family)